MPSDEVIAAPTLTRERAQALTAEVRQDVRALWAKVLELYEGGAHLALGYTTWKDYWAAEFGQSGSRGGQLVRAGQVLRVLSDAGVDVLPANDAITQALIPVFRVAPAELPAVWLSAVQASNGQPTAREVEHLVKPYRARRPGRNATRAEITEAQTRRLRNLVAMPMVNVHASAEAAHGNLSAALSTGPNDDMLREWLEHAERARALLGYAIRDIRRYLPDDDDDRKDQG